ncbi:hypothetical protein Nepgr_015343 [Nepenthes gracilis]|uniref:Pentatricopeptide repeat-containing protein n=1 Tax=Nepenthes gracilis TaxID=150966 RepID=A0AAD3SN38_NEPGR|nr:hypothetical protein Nepgr_015343 [Nepenthes gracilis]
MHSGSFPLGSKLPNWNVWIKESISNGRWEEAFSYYLGMRKSGVQLTDPSSFPSIFKACSHISFRHGESMHASSVKQGYESFPSVGNCTLDFYLKWNAFESSFSVFDSMRSRDSVSWNIMVHGNLEQGVFEDGLWYFLQARVAGFEPNVSTLVLVAQACRTLEWFDEGQKFHGLMLKWGFWSVISIQNSLLSMYSDAAMDSARLLFDEMPERDIISWSVMIQGYVHNELAILALQLYQVMVSGAIVEPDGQTMVSVLKACAKIGDTDMGSCIHGSIISRGLDYDVFVGNSLIDMYSKCFDADSAFRIFNQMPLKSKVSWNSILSGFVHNGMHSDALALFSSMGNGGVKMDEVTLVNLLQICKHFFKANHCKLIHSKIIQLGYELNELLSSALIDTYARCYLIGLAEKLFDSLTRRNIVSWGIMIAGFTHCGSPHEAIAIFQEMRQVGEKPNAIILLNLIEACAVSAELGRAKWAHGISIGRGLAAELAVGTAIVDMYSKCGALEASRKAFDEIHQKNILSWSAMVAAYGMNGRPHDSLALLTEMKQHGLKPNAVTALSVLSACSHGGLVAEGLSFFKEMVKNHGIEPRIEHFACVVDLLSRAGKLISATELIKMMPENLKGHASLWGALLSSCRRYGSIEIGAWAVSRVLEIEPMSSGGYLLASSMHAADGSWGDAARMRWLVNERGVRVVAGYSMLYVYNKAFKFVAGEGCNLRAAESSGVVEQLHRCMKIGKECDDDDEFIVE